MVGNCLTLADINSGSGSSNPGQYMEGHLVGDTMYFSADDGSTGRELWAHRPLNIGYNTNTSPTINASLPSGVSFGTNNGTIYGISPTELWTQTSYMVWANNSGGSSVAYLNITVVEELANIAYNPTSVRVHGHFCWFRSHHLFLRHDRVCKPERTPSMQTIRAVLLHRP